MIYRFLGCLMVFAIGMVQVDVHAAVFAENMAGDVLDLNADSDVLNNVTLDFDRVNISYSLHLNNFGNIKSDVYVQDGRDLIIQNAGTIDGNFYVGSGARVTQIIHNATDVNPLYGVTSHQIMISDAIDLDFSNVLSIAGNADRIIITDSILQLGTGIFNGDIQVDGDVKFHINYTMIDENVPVISNINGNGRVSFIVDGLNPMYIALSKVEDGFLYMKIVRDTDYEKIFDNDVGVFLNKLRMTNADDKLLREMDAAENMTQINDVMARAARLHPVKLMRPVRMLHQFNAIDNYDRIQNDAISGGVSYVAAQDTRMMDVESEISGKIGNAVGVYVGGHIGTFDAADRINDFCGGIIGARLGIEYDDDVLVAHSAVGVDAALFDSGIVLSKGKTVNNPMGLSGYFSADIGMRLLQYGDFEVLPFVGGLTDIGTVAENKYTDMYGNVGVAVSYVMDLSDLKYRYGGRVGSMGYGGQYLSVMGGLVLPDDNIVADISLATIHNEYGYSYKISAIAKYIF